MFCKICTYKIPTVLHDLYIRVYKFANAFVRFQFIISPCLHLFCYRRQRANHPADTLYSDVDDWQSPRHVSRVTSPAGSIRTSGRGHDQHQVSVDRHKSLADDERRTPTDRHTSAAPKHQLRYFTSTFYCAF